MDQKVVAPIDKKKRLIRIEAKLTVAQHAEFLLICEKLHMDGASAIRYSLLQESQKIITNVKGVLDTLDRLGPVIASSGDAITRVLNSCHNQENSTLIEVVNMEELLHQHILLQRQLEAHMRRLIKLMGNS